MDLVVDTQLCRLCAQPNSQGVPLNSMDENGRQLASLINKYLPIRVDVEKMEKYPKTVCFTCHVQLHSIVRFFNILLDGQSKLDQLLQAQEPIKRTDCGELYPEDHWVRTRAPPTLESSPKNKKKRGRPRKEDRLEVKSTEKPVEIPPESEADDVPPGKRVRKKPSRFSDAVQGKELERVFRMSGVIDSDSGARFEASDDIVSDVSKEVIGRMENGDGVTLGDVVVLNKPDESHRKVLQFRCDACHLVFQQESKFLLHQRSHTSPSLSCDLCNDKFTSIEKLNEHQALTLHFGHKTLTVKQKCVCGSEFLSHDELQAHIDAEHPPTHECPECQKHFRFPAGLAIHVDSVHKTPKTSYPCAECGKKFKHLSSVAYHKDTEHSNGRKFVCSKCDMVFKHRQMLQRHQHVHSTDRPFSCDTCSTSFKTKANLATHVALHSGNRKYRCEVCANTFSHKTSLKLHERWHYGIKPFECDVCNKTFTQKGNLQEHMRTHTGEKPYSCNICGRKFTTSSQHRLHLKRHLGEKPFKCEYCGRGFLNPDSHRVHLRRHRGEKPFPCNFCSKTFPEQAALRKHVRLHTGEKPFSCANCGKQFADRSNLKKHKKTHENVQPISGVEPIEMESLSMIDSPDNRTMSQIWTVLKAQAGEHFMLEKDNSGPPPGLTEDELLQVLDEDGNPLRFTSSEGAVVQVTTVDGECLHLTMSDGSTIPFKIAAAGDSLSPLKTVEIPNLEVNDCLGSVDSLTLVDPSDVRLLSAASLDFL